LFAGGGVDAGGGPPSQARWFGDRRGVSCPEAEGGLCPRWRGAYPHRGKTACPTQMIFIVGEFEAASGSAAPSSSNSGEANEGGPFSAFFCSSPVFFLSRPGSRRRPCAFQADGHGGATEVIIVHGAAWATWRRAIGMRDGWETGCLDGLAELVAG